MEKLNKILLRSSLLLLIVVSLSSFAHDYFVSITNININKESKQLQIEMKLDAADLEKAILKEFNKEVNLDEITVDESKVISQYLVKHFSIWINGGSSKIQLIGVELNPDGNFWCYLTSELPEVTQSIKIKNDILISTFIQQHNIVNVKADGIVKSHTFINKQITHTFKLDAK